MKLDPERFERQKDIVRLWIAGGRIGTLEAVTGFGKSMIGKIAERVTRGPSRHVIVSVPSLALQKQWEGHAKKAGWPSYEIWTVQSLIRQNKLKCDLLIADEIHGYSGPEFRKLFDIVEYDELLGLTATLDSKDDKQAIIRLKAPVFATVSSQEALDAGWVNPWRIYNLGVEFDADIRKHYDKLSAKLGSSMSFFDHDFRTAQKVLYDAQLRQTYATRSKLTTGQVIGLARRVLSTTKERKDLLYSYLPKLDKTVEICREHPERNIIVFGQSIESADYVANQLGPRYAEAYHSSLKGRKIRGKYYGQKALKENILERFCKPNQLHVLSTAKALEQGVDIPILDTGIVYAGTSKSRQMIQRLGRIVRKIEGKIAIWIEIYVLDSQDDRWLARRQQGIPDETLNWIRDPSEIDWSN